MTKAGMSRKNKDEIQGENGRRECLLLLAAVIVTGLICYAIHGAWPFGSLVLEGDDGYRQHIPELYYLWDMLHGKAGFTFDWYTSFGVSPVGSFIHFGIFSPLNIVYLFIPRSAVICSVNIMTLLRLVLLAFSFRYALKKFTDRKLPSCVIILLSLAYAFNSWSIHYLYFSQWIDVAILLPVLVSEAVELMKGIRKLPYIISLAVALLICIQQDYMLVLFFVFFIALFLIFSDMEKQEKGRAVIRLGIYSIAAACISCVILLTAAVLVGDTARVSGNIIYQIKQILRSNASPDHTYDKEKLLLMVSCIVYSIIAAVMILIRLILKKDIKRKMTGCMIFALMLILPLFAESIHYFWQGGEYICFPLRNGYMPVFVLLMLTGMLFEDLRLPKALKKTAASVIATVAAVIILIPVGINRMKRAELGYGKSKSGLYETENALYTLFKGSDPAERFIDKRGRLQLNYTLVSRVSAQENWIHIIPALCQSECDAFGYRHDGSALYGKGGTVFSDAVLGTRYALAGKNADERLYRPYAEAGGVQISECLYRAPFGFFLNNVSTELFDRMALEIQNDLAYNIWGEELFTLTGCNSGETVVLHPESDIILYFENATQTDAQLKVGGESVNAPVQQISYIGIFSGETEISSTETGTLAYCSVDDLFDKQYDECIRDLKMQGSSLSCRVDYDGGKRYLFLPVNNMRGWECTLNGKKTETLSVYGGFMAIVFPDEAGEYELMLKYHPPYQAAGIIICVAAVVFLIADRRLNIADKIADSPLAKISCPVYLIGAALLFALIYIADIALLIIL